MGCSVEESELQRSIPDILAYKYMTEKLTPYDPSHALIDSATRKTFLVDAFETKDQTYISQVIEMLNRNSSPDDTSRLLEEIGENFN